MMLDLFRPFRSRDLSEMLSGSFPRRLPNGYWYSLKAMPSPPRQPDPAIVTASTSPAMLSDMSAFVGFVAQPNIMSTDGARRP